jgi:hypothetical protein
MPNTVREPDRFVDMRIPLHWLLSTAGAIIVTLAATLWNIAQQTNKLDTLIEANSKLEKRLDDRDIRLDVLKDRVAQLERAADARTVRLENVERTLNQMTKR